MAIIAIARHLGSGGSEVAYRVADELGYGIVDRTIVEDAAAQAGVDLDAALMGDADIDFHTVKVIICQIIAKLEDFVVRPRPARESFEYRASYWKRSWNPILYAAILQNLIRRATENDRVVVLGRGANFILEGTPNTVRVLILGSTERRAERLVKTEGLAREFAREIVAGSDQQRSGFIRRVFGKDWMDPAGYDLVFDTDRVADDEIVRAIVGRARSLDPTSFTGSSGETLAAQYLAL